MEGKPPIHRRRFLSRSGRWCGAASVLAATAIGGDRLRLRADRLPLWHPQCSGFNSEGGLVVRKQELGSSQRETLLRDNAARLWCLCGGKHSETDLARLLIIEEGLNPAQANAVVVAFLEPLYQAGFLVPISREIGSRHSSCEVEHPNGLGFG